MIEITLLNFLAEKLSVPVYQEYPSNPPERFVVLRKADSSRENLLDSAMFVADSYAEPLLEAAKLNEQVKAALDALPENDAVSSSRRAGDYPAFDNKNKRHRYQAVYNITHY